MFNVIMFMAGIATASFFDPATNEAISTVVYEVALFLCDVSRAIVDFVISLFTGGSDV